MPEIRILLIEDDAENALFIRRSLLEMSREPFKLRLDTVSTLEAGMKRIAKGNFDAVLLDLFLPDSRGLSTFQRVQRTAQDLPIIVLAPHEQRSLGLESLWQGAQDYLIKGRMDAKTLCRVIRSAMERHRMQLEASRAF